MIAERENQGNRVQMNLLFVDYDFLKTYSIPLLAGRDFSEEITTDVNGKVALLNEAAMKAFGWNDPSTVVGRQFDGFTEPEAIGVVKDFHFISLHESVGPLMLLVRPRSFQYLSLRLKTENTAETMAFVQKKVVGPAARQAVRIFLSRRRLRQAISGRAEIRHGIQ